MHNDKKYVFASKLIFGFFAAQEERSKVRQRFYLDHFFNWPETEEGDG